MIAQCSVLFVDDDADFLAILSRRFQRRGYTVTAVCQPGLALDALKHQTIHVAVLDRGLPEQDGLELMQSLRQLDPELPVVVLSGDSSAEAEHRAMDLGAFAYLTKPCTLADLEAATARAFAARESQKRENPESDERSLRSAWPTRCTATGIA